MDIKKIRLNVPQIEAVKLTNENIDEVAEWCGGVVKYYGDEGKARVVIPVMGSTIGGESFYPGCWLIRNPETPGHISYLSNDEMFRSVYTEVEPISASEIAEVVESTMKSSSRSVRSLSFEAGRRVFDRMEQRAGKKILCIHCETEKNFSEMALKADGDPSSMCSDCEKKRLAEIDEYKTARQKLKERGLSNKAIGDYLGEN